MGEQRLRGLGLIGYFWSKHRWRAFLGSRARVRLKLLAMRDWTMLVRCADRLPLLDLRMDLWDTLRLHEDRELILKLLRTAPPVFEGGEWTGSTVALTALDAGRRHLEGIYNRLKCPPTIRPVVEAEIDDFIANEVPTWLEAVFKVAMERLDARPLLLLFGTRQVKEAVRPVSNGRAWSCRESALAAIRVAMGSSRPSVEEMKAVRTASGAPEEPGGTEDAAYLLTAAALKADSCDVWKWYGELLVERNSGLCEQAADRSRGLVYDVLAERVAALPDAFEAWRGVWNALFVTDRERARFVAGDIHVLLPSCHLLWVGAELLRQEPARAGAPEFLEELIRYSTYLSGTITGYRRLPSGLPYFLVDLFPRVHEGKWSEAFVKMVTAPRDAAMRVMLAYRLLEGGARFSEVAMVLKSDSSLMDEIGEVQGNNMPSDLHEACRIVAAAADGCSSGEDTH